jgi:hypothetical protein
VELDFAVEHLANGKHREHLISKGRIERNGTGSTPAHEAPPILAETERLGSPRAMAINRLVAG